MKWQKNSRQSFKRKSHALSLDMTEDEVVVFLFFEKDRFFVVLSRFPETYFAPLSRFRGRLLYVLRQPNHIGAPDPVFYNVLFVVPQEEVRIDSDNPKSTFLIKSQLTNT